MSAVRSAALKTLKTLLAAAGGGGDALPQALRSDIASRVAALAATERNAAVAAQVGTVTYVCLPLVVSPPSMLWTSPPAAR